MMRTNGEYLMKMLVGTQITQGDVELILLKSGLASAGDLNIQACDEAVYNHFSIVLRKTTSNVSEAGYSVSWNLEAVKMYYRTLCLELGRENVLEQQDFEVQDRSGLW